ncbi:MAG: STAS domain-containing protein [Acidobacteriia bacterium]|nr:STAS domain-containing protein [Terriglobia bacterium]MBV8905283.1 STAS domain-containing protein [Terriglobia bacterium]
MSDQAADSPFTLEIERHPDVAVVRCHGRLVSGSHDVFYTEVRPLIPTNKRVVLDFTHLAQMDSMGLGTLIRLYVSAKTGGCSLELINVGPKIRQLLGITNVLSAFAVVGENGIPIH